MLDSKYRIDFKALDSSGIAWVDLRKVHNTQNCEEDVALSKELASIQAMLQDELITSLHLPVDLILPDPDGNPIGVLGIYKINNSLRRFSGEVLKSLGFPFMKVEAGEVT